MEITQVMQGTLQNENSFCCNLIKRNDEQQIRENNPHNFSLRLNMGSNCCLPLVSRVKEWPWLWVRCQQVGRAWGPQAIRLPTWVKRLPTDCYQKSRCVGSVTHQQSLYDKQLDFHIVWPSLSTPHLSPPLKAFEGGAESRPTISDSFSLLLKVRNTAGKWNSPLCVCVQSVVVLSSVH